MNYEGRYFPEGFLHNLWPSFDIAFAQLGVIPRTKNKFDEIVGVAECYLITNRVKNIKEATVPNMPSCKLANGRMSVKKEKNYLHFSVWARWMENLFHEDKLNMAFRLSI